jgi:aspartyl-tRNA(Asn)/glutamyl-tRNA(Gln) amidotransferase subunit A
MGSVRIPSAYCGVAGVKPSKGVVPSEGLLDLSPTLDHVGVHAACAADLAAILNVFSIQTSRVGGPTVAMARWGTGVAVEPDIEAAFDAAEGMLRTMAEIVPVDVSGFDFAALRRKGLLISEVEGHRVHEEKLKTARSGFSNAFADLLEWGARQPEERIERAYADVRAAAARFAGLFDGVDAIALPTAPQGPFPFEANVPANQADLTCIANFGGFPAVAVPASAEGAPPASIQFIGRPGADGLVLGLAAAFEEARGTAPRPVRFLAP